MIPIYASDRANVAAWYAFEQPLGIYVVWDGGMTRDNTRTGMWNATTGSIIDVADAFLNRLPNMPLAGFLTLDHFAVTGIPDVEVVVQFGANPLRDTYVFEQPLNALSEILSAPNLLDGETSSYVPVRILSEDRGEALRQLRALGPRGLARHPLSEWQLGRHRTLLCNSDAGVQKTTGRIREFTISEETGEVRSIAVWINPETVMDTLVLYRGDEVPGALSVHQELTVWHTAGVIVGYE